MLAAPVVLEYVTDYQKTARGILTLLGCVAASVFLPAFVCALAVGEAAMLYGGLATIAMGIQATNGKLLNTANILPDRTYSQVQLSLNMPCSIAETATMLSSCRW